jgi:glutathione S-transferase
MKLYCNRVSPSSRRVLLTAAVLDIQLEEEQLDLLKGQHKSPEYLKLNPMGALPTLVDGAVVLTESRAIMQYLAAPRGEPGLLPRDEPTRAEVTSWQFWDAAHFSVPVAAVGFEKIFKGMLGMGAADAAKVEEALAAFRRYSAVLDARLSTRQYIVGSRLTLADLTVAGSLMYATALELPLAEFSNVQAWLERMTALPAWKKTAPQ